MGVLGASLYWKVILQFWFGHPKCHFWYPPNGYKTDLNKFKLKIKNFHLQFLDNKFSSTFCRWQFFIYNLKMKMLMSYIQIYIFWFDNTFWWQFSDFWKIFRFFEILWPETWHLRHWLHVTLTLITLLTIENNIINNYFVTFE